jgi:hypothetical protein
MSKRRIKENEEPATKRQMQNKTSAVPESPAKQPLTFGSREVAVKSQVDKVDSSEI